jgi:toxin ParE1/3/4
LRRLVFAPSARDDLQGIARYIQDAAGADLAAQVIIHLRDKCQLLAQTPGEIGIIRDEIIEGLGNLSAKPYVLFFRYSDSTVEIVRILHERQDVASKFDGD